MEKLAVVERFVWQLGKPFQVMLLRTFRNDGFYRNTALQCWINSIYSKQCRNNVATLYCTKNRRRKSSRVTSPLVTVAVVEKLNKEPMYGLSAGTKKWPM